MKKTILFMLALACLFCATACNTGSGGNDDPAGGGDPSAITATTLTVSLDTASGSPIPEKFNATYSWKIKDSDWNPVEPYSVQAYFAGTDGKPVAVGGLCPLINKKQEGSVAYSFQIPAGWLPETVKRPYELSFVLKMVETEIIKSETFTYTDGKISGVYTGSIYYYTEVDASGTPTNAEEYAYKATLVQYGDRVAAHDIYYLQDLDGDGIKERETIQPCDVLMTASVENGKTKLTGYGSYTNSSNGLTNQYSGEAYVFGDGRSISCDSYWFTNDPAKKSCGTFDCTKMGTSSIKGTVTISGTDGRSDLKFTEGEGTCVAAVLFGFDGDDMEDNAGAMTMGKVAVDGGIYTFAYEIKDIPAGEYYIFFGGLDQGDDVAEGDRLPDKTGEAVGVRGTDYIKDVAVLTDWIDGNPSDATKAAIAALKPIVVKEGEPVLNVDFTAYVRSTDAPTP